jgi:general secretion pathway protein E
MVGETRDQETAEMAIQASLTGHFVLSTLHTNDASSAPTRLIDMGVQPFLISSSLVAVLAQRLVRKLCIECKQPTTLSEHEMQMLDVETIPDDADICKAVGCDSCNMTGYGGMTVVAELLHITDRIRPLIIAKADASTIKKAAMKDGMATLADDAVDKIFAGITSVDEVLRAIISESEEQ